MKVKIITDSGCDLPKEIIDQYNIDVMPLLVDLNHIEYEDGKTIQPKELYEAMRGGQAPKTAQVPVQTMKETFTVYAKQHMDCLYIAFSSGLSGTYQTAQLVRDEMLEEYPDFKLTIIDSKCASMGQGLAVYLTATALNEHTSLEDICSICEEYCRHVKHIFTVDDLEYLLRGGRVSRTSAFVGSLLKIKPLLVVDDGKLVPVEKIRGRKKVLKRMVELMVEQGVDLKNQTIAISHGDDIEDALELKKLIEEATPIKDCIISYVGCSIGSHSGPGTLALFFLDSENHFA